METGKPTARKKQMTTVETKSGRAWDMVTSAILAAGYKFIMNHGGKYKIDGVVTIRTEAPRSIIKESGAAKSSITFR
jgi:hypothetical protein